MEFLYFYRVVIGYIRENPLFNRTFHLLGVLFKFRAVQWVFENSVSRAKGFPFRINIETTNYCNARCSICPYGDMTRGKGFMDMGLYKKIIDECALHRRDIHVVSLYMHGEPLLDKYLAERVRYAKDKGIRRVHLSTNGSLLGTPPGISLLETGLDALTISFDGMSAESYESIRCGLSFDNVFKNIDVFLNERKRRGLKSPKVILQVIKTPLNSSELNQIKKHFKPLVDEVVFISLEPWMSLLSEKPVARGKKYRMLCPHLFFKLTVLCDGRVSACCLDYDGQLIMGDLNESTIRDVWHGERYQQMREKSYYNKLNEYSLCGKCQSGGW